MTPEDQERLHTCTQEIAEILYRNSDTADCNTLEAIEITVRQQMLENIMRPSFETMIVSSITCVLNDCFIHWCAWGMVMMASGRSSANSRAPRNDGRFSIGITSKKISTKLGVF